MTSFPSRSRQGDDRGSMPIAVLFTMIGLSLSALLASLALNQITATRRAEARTQGLSAAMGGLDVAVATIRTAESPVIGGDRRKLPCTIPAGDLSDRSRYEVTIDYFTVDPAGHQADTTAIEGSRVTCTPGSGTTGTPGYALLRARGTHCYCDSNGDGTVSTGEAAWRTVHATYTVSTTDEATLGGEIKVYRTPALCIGTNVAPDDGSPLVSVACGGTPPARKLFAYPPSLQLRMADSRTEARPQGLCVHAPAAVAETALILRPCASGTEAAQRWGFRGDTFIFEGTSDNVTSNGLCFNLQVAHAINTPVVLRTGAEFCTPAAVGMGGFSPSASVGPGNAGPGTRQLVNRGEVGRCLDLTDDDVTGVRSREDGEGDGVITYPCKQVFNGLPHWNHVWAIPTIPEGETQATGRIIVTPGETTDPGYGVPYCLKTPGTGWFGDQSFVWVEACATADPADVTWTVYGRTPLVQDSYRIVDEFGNCLQSNENPTSSQQRDAWSRVRVAPCDGSYYQKWNAPPILTGGPLKDYGE
jgi:hypothetical protein